MEKLPLRELLVIQEHLQNGDKRRAINHHRTIAKSSLQDASRAIDAYVTKERQKFPNAFPGIALGATGRGPRINRLILLFFAGFFAWQTGWLQGLVPEHLQQELARHLAPLRHGLPALLPGWLGGAASDAVAPVRKRQPPPDEAPATTATEPPDPDSFNAELLDAEQINLQFQQALMSRNGDGGSLGDLYRDKLANPAYIEWKSQPGLPRGYQDFPEERRIKQFRSAQAAKRQLPPGQSAHLIPQRADLDVRIDGSLDTREWAGALRLPALPKQTESSFLLQADASWLYLAADVPLETTATGFDQFRFLFHLDLLPELVNERIHVSGRGSAKVATLGGIRQTTVRWQGAPAKNHDERWKNGPLSDWRIYRHARGASDLQGHRQYEAKIELAEAGLHAGVAFPTYLVIETDPLREGGKFVSRRYLGQLGAQKEPVWLLIQPPDSDR